MPSVLVDQAGFVRTAADGRVIVGEAGDACCCGPSTCERFVRATWCCSAEEVRWIPINDPACSLHDPNAYVIPTDVDRLVLYRFTGATACYRTDHTDVRLGSELPADALVLRRPTPVLSDEVVDAACTYAPCPPCPGCCGSKANPPGECGLPECCTCGNEYTLIATVEVDFVAVIKPLGASCGDANVVHPQIELPPIPFLERSVRWRGQAEYRCLHNERDHHVVENQGTETFKGYRARWRVGCCDGPAPGLSGVSASADQEWSSPIGFGAFGAFGEGCGQSRNEFFASGLLSPMFTSFSSLCGSTRLSDGDMLRDCAGEILDVEGCTPWPIPCSCAPGGPAYQRTTWSGYGGCMQGSFTISQKTRTRGAIVGDCTPVQGGTCSIFCGNSLDGMVESTGTATVNWSIVNRTPCPTGVPDPCNGEAQPALGQQRSARVITPADPLSLGQIMRRLFPRG